jgi:hypothetical protein
MPLRARQSWTSLRCDDPNESPQVRVKVQPLLGARATQGRLMMARGAVDPAAASPGHGPAARESASAASPWRRGRVVDRGEDCELASLLAPSGRSAALQQLSVRIRQAGHGGLWVGWRRCGKLRCIQCSAAVSTASRLSAVCCRWLNGCQSFSRAAFRQGGALPRGADRLPGRLTRARCESSSTLDRERQARRGATFSEPVLSRRRARAGRIWSHRSTPGQTQAQAQPFQSDETLALSVVNRLVFFCKHCCSLRGPTMDDEGLAMLVFADIDVDNSGALDKDELDMAARKLGVALTQREIDAGFAAMDNDGNGEVDFDEFFEWFKELKKKDRTERSGWAQVAQIRAAYYMQRIKGNDDKARELLAAMGERAYAPPAARWLP